MRTKQSMEYYTARYFTRGEEIYGHHHEYQADARVQEDARGWTLRDDLGVEVRYEREENYLFNE